MTGILPFVICVLRGCVRSTETGTCSRCGKLTPDRENLLHKTLQRNKLLAQENKSHCARIKGLKRQIKSGTIR